MDRQYCYLDFYMHSSLVAFTGMLFFLSALIRATRLPHRIYHAMLALGFIYLVLLHNVRASYVALIICVPAVILLEWPGRMLKKSAVLLGLLMLMVALIACLNPSLVRQTAGRVGSIANVSHEANTGRIVIWRRAIEVFQEHPVNGIGLARFNRFHVDLHNTEHEWSFWHAHNEILGLLAETGLIGVFCWLFYKFRLIALLVRKRKSWIGAFSLYLIVCLELHNLFEMYLQERTAYIFVYTLLGLGLNQLTAEDNPEPDQSTDSRDA